MSFPDFSADNPFPLLDWESCFRQAAKLHSAQVDAWLGFDLQKSEAQLAQDCGQMREDLETWAHLSPQVFQTSYVELRAILEWIQAAPGELVLDLGCAYARMAFVIARHYPKLRYWGADAATARVEEAKRLLGPSAAFELLSMDLVALDKLPKAEHVFMYDIGTTQDTQSVLNKLLEQKPKTLVLRGGRVRHLAHQTLLKLWEPREALELLNLALYRL